MDKFICGCCGKYKDRPFQKCVNDDRHITFKELKEDMQNIIDVLDDLITIMSKVGARCKRVYSSTELKNLKEKYYPREDR